MGFTSTDRPSLEETVSSEDRLLEHAGGLEGVSLEDERNFENVSLEKGNHQKSRKRRFLGAICTPTVVIHLSIISLYTFIFFFALWTKLPPQNDHGPGLIYSPARDAVKFERVTFHGSLNATNPYKGPPSPEIDAAWHDLLAYTAIRVSGDTLKKINRESVPLGDGNGYFATLDVYHQLHCLKYIRHYVHPEYYNITEPNVSQHLEHCLDLLRQYVMCKADISVNTYDWIPNFPKPWPNFETEHECANWGSIHDWAREHTFNGLDPALISHPDYHPELPPPFEHDD